MSVKSCFLIVALCVTAALAAPPPKKNRSGCKRADANPCSDTLELVKKGLTGDEIKSALIKQAAESKGCNGYGYNDYGYDDYYGDYSYSSGDYYGDGYGNGYYGDNYGYGQYNPNDYYDYYTGYQSYKGKGKGKGKGGKYGGKGKGKNREDDVEGPQDLHHRDLQSESGTTDRPPRLNLEGLVDRFLSVVHLNSNADGSRKVPKEILSACSSLKAPNFERLIMAIQGLSGSESINDFPSP